MIGLVGENKGGRFMQVEILGKGWITKLIYELIITFNH